MRGSRSAARLVRRTPAGAVFRSAPVRELRRRMLSQDPAEVLAVLDALDAVGARVWLAGGWGVDALVGEVTRRHGDIDLLVDADDGGRAIVQAMAEFGYRTVPDKGRTGHWLPVRTVLRDGAGHTLDLLAVRTTASAPARAGGAEPFYGPTSFAAGTLAGRAVPCLSVTAQLRTHGGYPAGPEDRRDLRLLAARLGADLPVHLRAPGSFTARVRGAARRGARWVRHRPNPTALVLPALEADQRLDAAGARHANAMALPAHLTVLYPFAPASALGTDERRRLGDLFARFGPVRCSFSTTARFPGVLYLQPDAEARAEVARLTDAVARAWPSHPPYGGRFDDIVPHLTVHEGADEPAGLEARVHTALPLSVRFDEVWLVELAGDDWTLLDRYPLTARA